MAETKHYWQYGQQDKEIRKKFNIGNILCNGSVCHKCGEFIRSNNKHDYKECSCGNIAVDGGSWYVRRAGRGVEDGTATDVIVLYEGD